MKTNIIGVLLAGVSVFAMTDAALAMDTGGYYLGAGIGQTDFESPVSESELESILNAGGITSNVSIDDTDTGWKLFAGYQLNESVALEAGWVDLGKIDVDVDVTSPEVVSVKSDAEVDGLMLSLLGFAAINDRFDVMGRIGVFSWDIEAHAVLNDAGTVVRASADDDGTDVFFGLGLQYAFTQLVAGRAEWERYDIDGDDADLLSVSIAVGF